jgi:DNA-binding response OmpR family regulator
VAETILVVEDEPALQETLAYNLKNSGYTVETASDGRAGIEAARRLRPDLIILDVMLPEVDGFEVASLIRREMNSGIIMLTARSDEIDRVVGLEVGADDYLTKPFSMRELLARVKAMIRRSQLIREEAAQAGSQVPHRRLAFGDLIIDVTRMEASLDGQPLKLNPKEYELLLFLAEHKGRLLTREFVLERVWGWDFVGESRTVDVHIRWLRQKIEKDPANPVRIVTVRGGGYRFEG